MGSDRALGSGRASVTAAEAARYIAEFSAELAALARRSELEALACLLEMVTIEAVHTAGTPDSP